jgi:GH18 family chitinase
MIKLMKTFWLVPLSIILLNCGGGSDSGSSGQNSGGGGNNPVTTKPYVMGYFPNYYGYFNNNSASSSKDGGYGHSIANASYVIPGTNFVFPVYVNGDLADSNIYNQVIGNQLYLQNKDLTDKLDGLDALTYGFFSLESSGSIHFSDPWADLLAIDWQTPAPKVQELYSKSLGPKMITVQARQNLASVVSHGQFDAFINLKKTNGESLLKFISLGGWNGAKWIDYLSSEEQITTFIQSIQELHDVYNFDGIDFDIENSTNDFTNLTQFTTYFNSTFMNIINRLHQSQPNLLIAITVQADPQIINSIGSTLKTNKNSFTQLNLMTYDFNGAFNYAGGSGVTGFNSSLYTQTGNSTPNQFSVDFAVESIKQYLPLNMVDIGLPAYGRAAITGVNAANNGLFQTFGDSSSSIVLPGDLDTSSCSTKLGSSTICSGTFQYRYIMGHMVGKGFSLTDWVQNGVYNATTAYASSWTVESSSDINAIKSAGIANNYPQGPQSNVFIAFIDGKVAKSYGTYAKQKNLKGTIVWDVMGDMPYSDTTNSLIHNFRDGYSQ